MKRIASLLLVAVMMLTTVTSIFPPISVSAKTETTYVKRYTVLVLDTSGTVTFTSGGEKIYDADPALTNVKKASKHFLDNISSAEGDNYIAVVSYQDSARVVSEFSKDVSQITKKIDALSASGKSNISAGLEAANELLDRINDEDAIKNVVLCTTGLTWSGNSSYDGKYNDSIIGNSWTSSSTGVHLYAYANYALQVAEDVKKKANLYVLGLFQTMDNMPAEGEDVVELFQKTALDLATSASYYHNIDDIDHIEFVFGELAETIISDIKGTFKFRPADDNFGQDSTATYYYRDSYFSKPASYYASKHEEASSSLYSFASMSLCLEMSAFASLDATKHVYDERQSQNARQLLEDIRFDPYTIQTNEAFKTDPTANSMGVIIGQKQITVKGEEYTVLAVAMRGAGYGAEWAGNFNIVGSEPTEICHCSEENCDGDGNHYGFYLARNEAVTFIKQYISENNISGKVKLWITGFSRGGATSGLVGKWFDDHLDEVRDWNIELTFDDIYAFTFEAPMSTDKGNLTGKDYSNIFNILSPSDLVPKVAMSGNADGGWNFARPGDDVEGTKKHNNNIVLPTKQNNSNYEKLKALMKENLHSIDSRVPYVVDDYKDYDGYIFRNTPLSEAMDYVMNEVTEIFSTEEYAKNLQPLVMDLVQALLVEKKNPKISVLDVVTKFENYRYHAAGGDFFLETRIKIRNSLVSNLEEKLDEADVRYKKEDLGNAVDLVLEKITNGHIGLIYYIVSMFGRNTFYQVCTCDCYFCSCGFISDTCQCSVCLCSCDNCVCKIKEDEKKSQEELFKFGVFTTHFPEYCLAWMMSVDDHYQGEDANLFTAATRVVHINCPVNITVFDENGQVVAEFIDDVLQNPEQTAIYAYVRNGEKVIYLPADGAYSVLVTATGEGTMSYSVEEYSTLNGESLRSVAYLDIPLVEGKTFQADVPETMNASAEDIPVVYSLATEGKELTPDVDAAAEEIDSATCDVEVQLDGEIGGVITGTGEYLIGTRANLAANPFECYTFDGWYVGDEKISDELQYSFVVKEDVTVSARFVAHHTPDADDGDCTTAIACSVCNLEIVAASDHTWDHACDVDCNSQGCDYKRETAHTPAADDGDCSTAILCSVCGMEMTPAQDHVWDGENDQECNNEGCHGINPQYRDEEKSASMGEFLDSLANKLGITSIQLLMIAGGAVLAIILLIVVLTVIKRLRYR